MKLMQNKTAIIGGAAGAGFGALLGRYTIYPLWRNRQVDITAATDPGKAALYTTLSALVGGVAGYFIANRVSRDAAETRQRPRRVRERPNVYYHNALEDSPAAGVLTVIGVEIDGTPTLVFPGEIDSMSAETMAAWDAVSGHGGINEDLVKQLVRQRKRLSVAKELELIAKYDRQYGTALQRATKISWPKWYRARYDEVRNYRKGSGRMSDRGKRTYYAIQHRTDNGKWETEDEWLFDSREDADTAIRAHVRESGLSRKLYKVVKVKRDIASRN